MTESPESGAPDGRADRPGIEAVLRDVWDVIQTPMMIVDDRLDVLYLNPAAAADVEKRAGKAVPALRDGVKGVVRSDGSVLTEEGRPVQRALRGETVSDEEFVVPAADGEPAHRYLVSAHPLPARGTSRHALVAWRDVTGRWRAETERRSSLDQLTRMIDGASEHAILMLDPQGDVLSWSRSAERLKRYAEDDVLGQPFDIFFTSEDRSAGVPQEILRTAAQAGRALTGGLRVRGDGTRFWARGVVTALRDQQGVLTGFVKVTQDVSEEHEAKARIVELNAELLELNAQLECRIAQRTDALERRTSELTAVNAELEAFSYTVSHDLRAPLRAISGFSQLLLEDAPGALDEVAMHRLRRIESAATEMGNLIDGLLRLSRLQRVSLDHEPIDMTALAWDVWMELDVPLHCRLEIEPVPGAYGDPVLLRQVWVNLLDNAVKYSAKVPEPVVSVSGRARGSAVEFTVADNGVGFDEGHAANLFEPFHRLHHAKDFPGSGIGLALVRRIVRRHGGDVSAAARPGGGARFTFCLESA